MPGYNKIEVKPLSNPNFKQLETGDGIDSSEGELAIEGSDSSKSSHSENLCNIDSETADRTSIIYNGEA